MTRRIKPLAIVGSTIRDAEGLDLITLDATIREGHSASVELSTHPVDVATQVSEHAIVNPIEVEITGVVTNTPTSPQALAGLEALEAAGVGGDFDGRVAATFGVMLELISAPQTVTLVTGLRTYDDMMLVELNAIREGNPGRQDIRPRMNFVQVTFATAEVVDVPPDVIARAQRSSSAKKQDKGQQAEKQATPEQVAEANNTLALDLVNSLAKLKTDLE